MYGLFVWEAADQMQFKSTQQSQTCVVAAIQPCVVAAIQTCVVMLYSHVL